MDSSQPARLDCDNPPERMPDRGTRYGLTIDLEPATTDLMNWWLAAAGLAVRLDPSPAGAPALILVEIAYPRHDDRDLLQGVTTTWPEIPVILLSPTFFAETPSRGEVARRFGVAATLATPLSRDRLVSTVRDLLGTPR